jgi:hypothetical protein
MTSGNGKIGPCDLKLFRVHDGSAQIMAAEPIRAVGVGERIESMIYIEIAVVRAYSGSDLNPIRLQQIASDDRRIQH